MGTKVVVWNGVSSATIPELVIGQVWRKILGADRAIYREIAGREGAWVFPEKRGMREIRMQCYVQTTTFPGRRDAITDVANWLDTEGSGALTISDEPGIYYEASLGDPPEPEEWREVGTFEIRFICQPHSFDVAPSTHTVNDIDNFVDIWDPGVEVPLPPAIEITPTNGTLTCFDLTMNGSTIHWEGNLASGQTLTIDSVNVVVLSGAAGDVSLTGAYNPGDLNMSGVSGSFPDLLSGNNTMTFVKCGGTMTTVTIVTKYRKRYRR